MKFEKKNFLKNDMKQIKGIPIVGILTESFQPIISSTARLNFEFVDNEVITSHAVLPNIADSKGKRYDKHYFGTSHGNIYVGVTNDAFNFTYVYVCNIEEVVTIKILAIF